MTQILDYIKPELLVLILALYLIGMALKSAATVQDKYIPLLLGLIGMALAAVWVLATSSVDGWQSALLAIFTAIVQGILCAGASVYSNQLFKQSKKQ